MATKAKAAKGTLIQRGDGGGPEVFTTIGEVTNFSGPGETAETIDVTSFDSTAKEFISSGLPDNGEVTFDVNFVGSDAQQQGLRSDLRAGTLRNFKVILNDHATTKTTFAFAAIVSSIDGPTAGGVSEAYKMSVTLKLSGPATITYAP
jgi:predicted secreted protein